MLRNSRKSLAQMVLTKNVNSEAWRQEGTNGFDRMDSAQGGPLFLMPPKKDSVKSGPRSRRGSH
jgi:hypothetical protein